LTLVGGTSVVWAQSSAVAKVPATRQDILKLFDVMQIRQQVRTVMEQVAKQTQAMSREALKRRQPGITEEELARLDAMSEQTMKDIPIDGMLDDMVPVYQKHLDKTDVHAMIRFYSSPTGQKVLREMPAMAAEGMQAVYPRMQKQMDETMERVEQTAKEDQKKSTSQKPDPDK